MNIDPCECGCTDIQIDLPHGWQKMSQAQIDYLTGVRCPGCKTILKYSRTVPSTVPGFKWMTLRHDL